MIALLCFFIALSFFCLGILTEKYLQSISKNAFKALIVSFLKENFRKVG
jgi:hypothetical protein